MNSKGKKRKKEQKQAGCGQRDCSEVIQCSATEFHPHLESLGMGGPLNTYSILFFLKENSFACRINMPDHSHQNYSVGLSQPISHKDLVTRARYRVLKTFLLDSIVPMVLGLTRQLTRDLWENLGKCVKLPGSVPWWI